MRRLGTFLVVIAVAAALLAVPLGVAATVSDHDGNNTTDSIAPGERLGGVVGVQGAALAGDLTDRTYKVRIERAESDEKRAEIVDQRLDEIDRRLADHEERIAGLRVQRGAGTISEGTYRAKRATIAAETTQTERAVGTVEKTAESLPEAALTARGISIESVRERRAAASELTGPEIAEIARSVAGPNATSSATDDRRQGPSETNPSNNQTGTEPRQDRSPDNARDPSSRNNGDDRSEQNGNNGQPGPNGDNSQSGPNGGDDRFRPDRDSSRSGQNGDEGRSTETGSTDRTTGPNRGSSTGGDSTRADNSRS